MPRWNRLAVLAAAACFALGCQTTSLEDEARAQMRRDLGNAKLGKGENELAIREYLEAARMNPDDPETYFGLAEAYRRKKLPLDAERALLDAIRLDPKYHDAYLNLGVVYLEMARYPDSIAVFQKLVADPTFIRPARGLVNLGWAQYKSGDLAGATTSLERAIEVDPANYVAHLDLGIVLYDQGELVGAIGHFQKCVGVIEKRPVESFGAAEAEARYRMAQAHVRLGQRARALENLRVAVQRGGKTEWAQKSNEYLQVLQ